MKIVDKLQNCIDAIRNHLPYDKQNLLALFSEPVQEVEKMENGGLALIAVERERQIKKGYTAEHDDDETAMQLSYAAAAYIVNAQNLYFKDHSHYDNLGNIVRLQSREIETKKWKDEWPWVDKDGRSKADILTSLVKAGALIVAEIENELRNK